MRVALQFSGQLRGFVECYQFFKEYLLDNVEVDVFLSTWELNEAQMINDEGTLQEFLSLYNVVDYRTDKLNKDTTEQLGLTSLIHKCEDGNWYCIVKYPYMIYGFYHKLKCNELRLQYSKRKKIKYDIIISTRPDLTLAEPLNPKLLTYAKKHLLIPAGSDWEYGTCDLLAIGNSKNITSYCSLILNLEEYIKRNVLLHPEHLLKYHLDELNVPLKRFSYTTHLRCRRMT